MNNHRKFHLTTAIYLLEFLLFHYGQATVTLSIPNKVICDKEAIVRCHFTGTLATGINRAWRKGVTDIVYGGSSIAGTKYNEDSSLAASANYFDLIINPFEKADEDNYTCSNGGSDFNSITVSCTAPTTPEPTPTAPPESKDAECRTILSIGFCITGISVMLLVGYFLGRKRIFHRSKAPCCGFCICIYCGEKEEPDFKKFTEQELNWMDKMIADIKQVDNSDDDASTKLNESKKIEKDVEERLNSWKRRCAAEEENLSEYNSEERKIKDCNKNLQDKMEEWKTAKKLEWITGVEQSDLELLCRLDGATFASSCCSKIGLQSNYAIRHPSKPLEKEREMEATSTNSPLKLEN